jgi:hypothetical protein
LSEHPRSGGRQAQSQPKFRKSLKGSKLVKHKIYRVGIQIIRIQKETDDDFGPLQRSEWSTLAQNREVFAAPMTV